MANTRVGSTIRNRKSSSNAAVFAQTSLNGYYFDAYISITHSSTLNITQHPVQSGGVIADHAYMLPREVEMVVKVSDATVDPLSSFSGSGSRSVNAFKLLQQLQKDRTPITVYTKYDTYSNCLIKELSVEDNADLVEALSVNLSLVEIPVAYLETSKISIDWQTTNETKDGIMETIEAGEALTGTMRYQQYSGQYNWNLMGIPFGGMQ